MAHNATPADSKYVVNRLWGYYEGGRVFYPSRTPLRRNSHTGLQLNSPETNHHVNMFGPQQHDQNNFAPRDVQCFKEVIKSVDQTP